MTPTQTNVTKEEYHECSSGRCLSCDRTFYIMACGWDVSRAVECPHCEELHIFERMSRPDDLVFSAEDLGYGETSYSIKLKNGRILLIVEDTGKETISIGLASGSTVTHGHEAEAWICSMDASGVLVMPNSGGATADLVYQPTRTGK